MRRFVRNISTCEHAATDRREVQKEKKKRKRKTKQKQGGKVFLAVILDLALALALHLVRGGFRTTKHGIASSR